MPRDWKIGIVIGFVIISLGVFWLCANPGKIKTASLKANSEVVSFETDDSHGQMSGVSMEDLSEVSSESLKQSASNKSELELNSNSTAKTVKIYTVQRGDSLSSIAQRFYGDKGMWHKIRDANKIQNVHSLKAGAKLIIP